MFLENFRFNHFSNGSMGKRYNYLFKNKRKLWLTFIIIGILTSISSIYITEPLYSAQLIVPINEIVAELTTAKAPHKVSNQPLVIVPKQVYVNALSSRVLLNQVADSLPVQASISKKVFPFKSVTLYDKDLPVKIKILKNELSSKKRFEMKIADNSSVIINEGASTNVYRFNQIIEKPGLQFKFLKIPSSAKTSQTLDLQFYSRADAVTQLQNALAVEPGNRDTSNIRLIYKDENLNKARAVVKELYYRFLLDNFYNSKEAVKALMNIDKQIVQLKAEFKLYGKNKQDNLKPDKTDNATNTVNIQQVQKQVSIMGALKPYLKNSEKQFFLLPDAYSIQDDSLNRLITEINTAQLKKQDILKSEPVPAAAVTGLEKRIVALKFLITERINISEAYYKSITSSKQTAKIQLPKTRRTANQLVRDHQAKVQLYLYLVAERENLIADRLVARKINTLSANPIVSINRSKFYLFPYTLLGILIGFVLPLIFTRKPKDEDLLNITQMTSIPLLGELNYYDGYQEVILPMGENSVAGRQLLNITRIILDKVNSKTKNVLAVSSYEAKLGKTFVSINLANALAVTGKQVVLVDTQANHPDMTLTLGEPSLTGITDYLTNSDLKIEDIIQKTRITSSMDFIGIGTLPYNNDQIFTDTKFLLLIQQLKKQYDYVILKLSRLEEVSNTANLTWINCCINIVNSKQILIHNFKLFEIFTNKNQIKHPFVLVNRVN